MSCFWTDFVGTAEDCGSAPVAEGFAAGAGSTQHYNDFPNIKFYFGENGVDCWYGGDAGNFDSTGNPNRVALDSVYIKRLDFDAEGGSGCSIENGDAPDWFPLAAAACGSAVVPAPTASTSVDNLVLDMTPASSGGVDYFTVNIFDLFTAAVSSDPENGVMYIEMVGSNGDHFFATMVVSGCF